MDIGLILLLIGGIAFAGFVIIKQAQDLTTRNLQSEAEEKERQQFINDHSHDMPAEVSGEFWDLYH